jgi:hypothetical protein
MEWLDEENSPAPFDFSGMVYKDYTTYLSSNLKNNGVLLKGKVYMNKPSILNNLFKRQKFRASDEFSENVNKYMEGGVVCVVSKAAQEGLWFCGNGQMRNYFRGL